MTRAVFSVYFDKAVLGQISFLQKTLNWCGRSSKRRNRAAGGSRSLQANSGINKIKG